MSALLCASKERLLRKLKDPQGRSHLISISAIGLRELPEKRVNLGIQPHFPADEWFLVLADNEASSRLLAPIITNLPRLIYHSSGRPWIAGSWAEGELFTFSRGSASFAFLGIHAGRDWSHQSRWGGVSDAGALDELVKGLPGSFHFFASIGGECRTQGSASGLRRIFHDDFAATSIAANRQDVLTVVRSRHLNEYAVAGRLLFPQAPGDLETQSPWRGISSVPDGSWLRFSAKGENSVRRWWTCPDPFLSLAEGAALLRDRLTTSVDIATACDGKVSADLSGGFDSTSLCFLAARNHRHLLTFSSSGRANADDDLPWIELARQNLPSTRHLFVASDELPGPFDGISDFARVKADEPYIGTAMWKRIEFTAKTLQAAGSHFHITGHGGDEVLLSPDTYLYEWIRQRPLTATRRLNQFRSKRRWTFIALARAMLQSSTYQAYIGKVSNNIDLPFPEHLSPATCWGALEQRLPCWVSTHAVDLVRQLLREQGERFVPLHPSPAQHRCLEMIRSGAHAIRLTSQIMRQAGIRMVAPFLDDQIIDACLSVRHDEKTLPTSYKPLLSAAMQEIVPRTLLERSTKPNFGIDVFRGRRRNAEDLVAIAENLELVRIGLVRKDMFRDACLGLGQPTPPIALWKTLACEGWLRGLQI